MTKIYLETDGFQRGLICEGHASDAASCAAVSTLVCTLAGYLHNIPCKIMTEELSSGHARIFYRGRRKELKTAFDLVTIGFLQLEKSYPDAVKIIFSEKIKNF